MNLGKKIAALRREKGMTQEALAQRLGVTNQAVSKWEQDSCCPDIQLLPELAEVLQVSLDVLFDRPSGTDALPWADDGVLRVVLYVGHQLVGDSGAGERLAFCYEGPALNVSSQCSVRCADVAGDVHAGKDVICGRVGGNVTAGNTVTETP